MSVNVQAMVFEAGPQDLAQHSVMIALADNADDQGVAWPGDEYLSRKARMSVRNLIRVREELELAGWMVVRRRARVVRDGEQTYGNLYQLNMSRLEAAAAQARESRLAEKRGRRDIVSPRRPKRAAAKATCADAGDTVSRGDVGDVRDVTSAPADMTNAPFRHDTTLADVLLNQRDDLHNRHRTTIEPPSTPLPPLQGGESGEYQSIGGERVRFDPGSVMGGEFLESALRMREAEHAAEAARRPGGREPCGDCDAGRCTMNCGPCVPAVTPAVRLTAGCVWGAASVMRACGASANRRLEAAIAAALELHCAKTRCTPAEAAELAQRNVAMYQAEKPMLAFAWGWRKFFAEGHWVDPQAWPYDRDKMRELQQASRARVGMYAP